MKLSLLFLLILAAALVTAGLYLDWKATMCGAIGGAACMGVVLLALLLEEPGARGGRASK
jgi:hypothetical protein